MKLGAISRLSLGPCAQHRGQLRGRGLHPRSPSCQRTPPPCRPWGRAGGPGLPSGLSHWPALASIPAGWWAVRGGAAGCYCGSGGEGKLSSAQGPLQLGLHVQVRGKERGLWGSSPRLLPVTLGSDTCGLPLPSVERGTPIFLPPPRLLQEGSCPPH